MVRRVLGPIYNKVTKSAKGLFQNFGPYIMFFRNAISYFTKQIQTLSSISFFLLNRHGIVHSVFLHTDQA